MVGLDEIMVRFFLVAVVREPDLGVPLHRLTEGTLAGRGERGEIGMPGEARANPWAVCGYPQVAGGQVTCGSSLLSAIRILPGFSGPAGTEEKGIMQQRV